MIVLTFYKFDFYDVELGFVLFMKFKNTIKLFAVLTEHQFSS